MSEAGDKRVEFVAGGKRFRFYRPTISFVRRISKKGYETWLNGRTLAQSVDDERVFADHDKRWERFVLDVVELSWWRRVLKVIPRELEYRNLRVPEEVFGIAGSFFAVLREVTMTPSEPSAPSVATEEAPSA